MNALADNIVNLLIDPEKYQKLKTNAATRAKAFRLEGIVKNWEALFKEMHESALE